MRIQKLNISNYKNLNADLTHKSDIIAFIGNNGSGKSNILEAISLVFRSLFIEKTKLDFDYNIEYVNSLNQTISLNKVGSRLNNYVNEELTIDISKYLPNKVVAIYSGEEGRLFDDCFAPFYLEFVKGINKANNQGTDFSDLPKMLYLNKFYWHLSLLCLLISDSDDNKSFVKNILKINQVDKIKFDFNKGNYNEYSDNLALGLVNKIDHKSEYTLEELKEILTDNGYIPDDVYKFLYIAFTPRNNKIVKDIDIRFNGNLNLASLSEGEKKLLLIKAALEFAGQEDCLFILDEPDAHIHLNNKEQIIKCFEPYKKNRQIIITTHSPTITQTIQDDNVYMVSSGKIENKTRQEIIGEITGEFWNKHQQSSFLSSKKPIVLLVEGKHDKTHINTAFNILGDEYPNLDFEIFYMNSACNIPPMMLGLRTSEIEYDKLCIGLFDVDEIGNKQLTLSTCSFPNAENKKRHELGFYAMGYPKHSNHNSKDFTVENFYDTKHILEAYDNAFKTISSQVKGKSITSINEKLKDLAKTNLVSKAKVLTDKEDFKHFRLLFDQIKLINTHYINSKKPTIPQSAKPIKQTLPTPKYPTTISSMDSNIAKEDRLVASIRDKVTVLENGHLKNKSLVTKSLYLKYKQAILNLDSEIVISPQKFYIAFKKEKRNIVDIQIQAKNIKMWINLKKGELTDPENILRDVSILKGHNGNGDYELTINDDSEINYIMSLLKQAIS